MLRFESAAFSRLNAAIWWLAGIGAFLLLLILYVQNFIQRVKPQFDKCVKYCEIAVILGKFPNALSNK
ncbi:MAG: hypothetical protein JF615_06180 [Asticcacaulis sp.]|nr:hypothetical protein [Asticcacaulis sp.]